MSVIKYTPICLRTHMSTCNEHAASPYRLFSLVMYVHAATNGSKKPVLLSQYYKAFVRFWALLMPVPDTSNYRLRTCIMRSKPCFNTCHINFHKDQLEYLLPGFRQKTKYNTCLLCSDILHKNKNPQRAHYMSKSRVRKRSTPLIGFIHMHRSHLLRKHLAQDY